MAQPGHTAPSRVREREGTQTWGSAFTGAQGGVLRLAPVPFLLANSKHKKGN